MNKTQKVAWFCLVMGLLGFAFSIYIAVEIFILRRLPEGFGRLWGLLAFWLVTGIAIIFIQKKQSPGEPDFDERDNAIKKNAILACFISVWISLVAVGIIPAYVVGDDGSIPVCLLPIINTGILIVSMLIYSTAILVQYGWRSKGEKS